MNRLLFNPICDDLNFQYPDYIPKKSSDISACIDTSKYNEFIGSINQLELSDTEKSFLLLSATRFISFNYHFIADYYNNCKNEDMKTMMERLGLVILDKDGIIKNNYIKINEEIKKLIT